ncbi:MAG: RsmB/NOP family class I SAM-dependent RNA methyltransferase [Bdellovibrionaceae bacterium]|nr:RsmB/NOP family class I SAM-dependent RNA methyltransferase [Pseudobdellovibrionaceae bacterium]
MLERFEAFHRDAHGDRWPALRAALLQPERQILRLNAFAGDAAASRFASLKPCGEWGFWQSPEAPLAPERRGGDLLDVYIMDPASVAAATALEARPGERIVDLCAAPGGKTLIVAEALRGRGELISNDASPDRRERLTKVLRQYVPRDVREGHVFVAGKDGARFGLLEPGAFDRVLLDAPCSGERHLLGNPSAMAEWSPRRSENLAVRQYSLLSAAWLAVKAGGRIVYSTCSISPRENDAVVARLLKKKKAGVKVRRPDTGAIWPEEIRALAEETEHGWRFLPDRGGIGPIYLAVLEKALD